MLSENRLSQTEELQAFLKFVHWGNIHGVYNLGIMYLYGVGVDYSCPTALRYLQHAARNMVWTRYFPQVYDLYLQGQKRVAAVMYMLLSEMGCKSAQINAGNLLDGGKLLPRGRWIHSLEPNANLDMRLALKYYKMAAEQGSELANLRLGDFYYHGYETAKDLNVSLAYYERATHWVSSLSQLSHAWFIQGLLLHHGIGIAKNYTKARQAYNYSAMCHRGSYYPARTMMLLLDFDQTGVGALLPSVERGALLASTVFSAAVIFLIWRRRAF